MRWHLLLRIFAIVLFGSPLCASLISFGDEVATSSAYGDILLSSSNKVLDSSSSTPHVDENNIYTVRPENTVTVQLSGSSAPEPGSLGLLLALWPFAWLLVRLLRLA
jgi:hypothetical protein